MQMQKQNGRLVKGQDEGRGMTRDERLEEMNNAIGFMDIDSLIYYQNYFKDESQVFGRNIFNNKNLTFEYGEVRLIPEHAFHRPIEPYVFIVDFHNTSLFDDKGKTNV